MSFLLANSDCATLRATFSAVNLLNSGVVVYLLLSGILVSIALRAVVVARLVILGILF